ncbi:glycosyltransferase [Methylobacterium longum]|uniref:Glycosyltransferase n=1 Tax=Methylobacterium longum TaxID=767694 RepID=A0ABT8AWB3_9HYPH|nr:glycosyltransferase [Methylobacterium longum]MDN3573957.1 glycosyltransferase [Methylobacterium longum]
MLWLARTIPLPETSGDRIYTAQTISALAKTGARIDCMGLEADLTVEVGKVTNCNWVPVEGGKRPSYLFLTSRLPMSAVRHRTRSYRSKLRKVLGSHRYDVVVLDHYAMSWALDDIDKLPRRPKIVHLAHDFETDVTKQIKDNFQGNFVKKYLLTINHRRTAKSEWRLVLASDLIITLTDEDATHFQSLSSEIKTIVLPPGFGRNRLSDRTIDADTPRRVVAVGSFEWQAKQMNLVKFLKIADPLFARAGIEFHLIGRVPAELLAQLPSLRATTLRGFVENIDTEFSLARGALVFDESGGGFKLKMLDYLYNCVPIFGLTKALNGLPGSVMENVFDAYSLEGLVKLICDNIDDIQTLNAMQQKAVKAASDLFRWNSNGEKLSSSLKSLLLGE